MARAPRRGGPSAGRLQRRGPRPARGDRPGQGGHARAVARVAPVRRRAHRARRARLDTDRLGSLGAFALGSGGRPHGMLVVSAEQEDELRAFCNLVSRRAPHANEIAWALRRFELGCERASEYEGDQRPPACPARAAGARSLSSSPGGSARRTCSPHAWRHCAPPPSMRAALAGAHLEGDRAGAPGDRRHGRGAHERLGLARDLSDHLRALLRDVVCGHLPCRSRLARRRAAALRERKARSCEGSRACPQAGPGEPRPSLSAPQANSCSATAARPPRSCTSPSR